MCSVKRIRAIVAACAVTALGGLPASATTYYVRSAGNDGADGLTPRTAFQSVLRAAQTLNHGDRIVVGPGVYAERVLLAERFSADGAVMSIEGDESGKATTDAAGPVILQPASPAAPALRLHRFRNVRLSGLTFAGPGDGLALDKCQSVQVERCTFRGLRRALHAWTTDGLRVESCVFDQNTIALFFQEAVNTRLAHLTVVNSTSVGLLGLASGSGAVRNSILAANGTSAILDRGTAASWSSDGNVLSGTIGPWGLVPMVYFGHEWFAASGQDRHSVHVIPAFADAARGDLHPSARVGWGGGLPGAAVGLPLDPPVLTDRDGQPFAAVGGPVGAGAYRHPTPVPGWTRVAGAPAGGVRQSAGIYRADGSLVRMLVADAAGVRDLWWDGLDDTGKATPAGAYEVRAVTHDVRLADDGHFGDNGNPLGTYNCDNAERVAVLPDGRFVVATLYDEAGIPLRLYEPSGQSVAGVNVTDKDIWGLAVAGDTLVAGVGQAVALLDPSGDRMRMPTGAESYPLLDAAEALPKNMKPAGIALAGGTVYVSLSYTGVVRRIELATGKRQPDWPLPGVGDLATDETGALWALRGTDVIRLKPDGQEAARFATGLAAPRYLAAGKGRLAVVDRNAGRIAILEAATGKPGRTFGDPRTPGRWAPVGSGVWLNPRGAAFLHDGKLLVTEAGRVRVVDPDTGAIPLTIESNFMDVAVPHPLKPEYVYCHGGMVFRIDPASGAWTRVLEAPAGTPLKSLSTSVVLGGRPFIVAFDPVQGYKKEVNGKTVLGSRSRFHFIDVSDPLNPRFSTDATQLVHSAYSSIAFRKSGDLLTGAPRIAVGQPPVFHLNPFLGLDAKGDPQFNFTNRLIRPAQLPVVGEMGHNGGICIDSETDDVYYMAVTTQHSKMVPAWGASGTGMGKSRADGTPLWFSPSSGGNATSADCIRDARHLFVFFGKDFGGQIDVFDEDGLRLATGNWAWPCNWLMGFVDLRFALQAYLRPDGKPGLYVEDDNIGRFARARVDGSETLRKTVTPLTWPGMTTSTVTAAVVPNAERVAGATPLARAVPLPKVPPLAIDGDWSAWERAGVVPQVVALPAVTWGRTWPEDLFQTFRQDTAMGAFAHDGTNLYACFVVTDDTLHFAAQPATMWMQDSVELWLEEEQIGIGLTTNGAAALFKYRFHNREGREWSANYALSASNVWGRTYTSLAGHPLGRQLSEAVGVSFEGKPGYVLMARIPFVEIKLVGGIAGRGGQTVLPMTGQPGEVLRIGVAFNGVTAWGREQDFKVYWPTGLMFSDPTRNIPFVLMEGAGSAKPGTAFDP
jgi:hypothetical protein